MSLERGNNGETMIRSTGSNIYELRKNAVARVLSLLRSGAYNVMTATEIAEKAQVPDTICKDKTKFVYNVCLRHGYKKTARKSPIKHEITAKPAETANDNDVKQLQQRRPHVGARMNRSGPRMNEGRRSMLIDMVKEGASVHEIKQLGFKTKEQIYNKLIVLRDHGYMKEPIPAQYKPTVFSAAIETVEEPEPIQKNPASYADAMERLLTLRAIELLEEMLAAKKASLNEK
jgi:hypothetical protein